MERFPRREAIKVFLIGGVAKRIFPSFLPLLQEGRLSAPSIESETATLEQLIELDQKMFDVVRINKLPPTLASKYFANITYAQFVLSRLGNFNILDLSNLNAEVTRILLPAAKHTFVINSESSQNTQTIQEIAQSLKERNDREKLQVRTYPIKEGEQYWKGINPVTPDACSWTPWFIGSVDDFVPPSPPEYGSEEDKLEINAVKSALRDLTPAQSAKALYWAGGSGTETPSGIWLGLLNNFLKKEAVPFNKASRVRYIVAAAMEDAFIACWDAKFKYQTQRPFMRDEEIKPIIETPNFPSYVSGHSTISAVAATILSHYFPDMSEYWLNLALDAKDSRLWAGIHFPVDNDEGFILGQKIAISIIQQVRSEK